jgi:NAD(P)-dependent dehydrogenase (short-subunit alcohol dehydrogenase family)
LPANEGINMIMKNKTILITGGATGIGLATAKLLNVEGAKIIVTMSCRRHRGPRHASARKTTSSASHGRHGAGAT